MGRAPINKHCMGTGTKNKPRMGRDYPDDVGLVEVSFDNNRLGHPRYSPLT